MSERPAIWMVSGTPYERGGETPTWGPFETKDEAQEFANRLPGRRVYDDIVNRASKCGPWLP